MHWLCSMLPAVALGAALQGCGGNFDSGVPEETSAGGDLCFRACERRVQRGCATDSAVCVETCAVARAAGYCSEELETNLACVAEADDLRCGRAPNGGPCDEPGVALERCVSGHREPPIDCYDTCA